MTTKPFAAVPALASAAAFDTTPRRSLFQRIADAVEAAGRRRALAHFDRMSDADLARLGLDRATIEKNLTTH